MAEINKTVEATEARVEDKKDEAKQTYDQATGAQHSAGYEETMKRLAERKAKRQQPVDNGASPQQHSAGYEETMSRLATRKDAQARAQQPRPDFRSSNNPAKQAEQFKADTTVMNNAFSRETSAIVSRSKSMADAVNNASAPKQGEQGEGLATQPLQINGMEMAPTQDVVATAQGQNVELTSDLPSEINASTGKDSDVTMRYDKEGNLLTFNKKTGVNTATYKDSKSGEYTQYWKNGEHLKDIYADGTTVEYWKNGKRKRQVSPGGTIFHFNEDGELFQTTYRKDYEPIGFTYKEMFGRSEGNSLYDPRVLGVNLNNEVIAALGDPNLKGGTVKNNYASMPDAQLTQAIMLGNSGGLGQTVEDNVAELREAVLEKTRRALGFASVSEMQSLKGVRDLRMQADTEWLLNDKYYGPAMRRALNGEKINTDDISPFWMKAWDEKIKNQKGTDDKQGKGKAFVSYLNELASQDPDFMKHYAAWCLLQAYQSGYKSWEQVMSEKVGEFLSQTQETYDKEQQELLDAEAKRLADNKFLYSLEAVRQQGVIAKFLDFLITPREQRQHAAMVFNRANDYNFAGHVGTGWQLAGGGLAFMSDAGVLKVGGNIAKWTAGKLLGEEFLEYAIGKRLISGLNLGLYNVANLATTDLQQHQFSGMSYLTTFGSGAVMGSSLSWTGSKLARGFFNPDKKIGEALNTFIRFAGEGATLGGVTTLEQMAMGDKITLYENFVVGGWGLAGSLKIPQVWQWLRGKAQKRFIVSEDRIKEVDDLGCKELAAAMRENRDRIRNEEDPIKYTGKAREQYEQLFEDMRNGGRVSWRAYAEIADTGGDYLPGTPRPVKSQVVERGGNHFVQILDGNNAVVTEIEYKGKKSKEKAEKDNNKMMSSLNALAEAYNYADYNYSRQSFIFSQVINELYEMGMFKNDQSPTLADGSPNPDYLEIPPGEILDAYYAAEATPEAKRTQFEQDLVREMRTRYQAHAEKYKEAGELMKEFADQYDVFIEDFVDAYNKPAGKRGKGAAAQAVNAYNEYIAKGFHAHHGKPQGKAILKDGTEVTFSTPIRKEADGSFSDPNQTMVCEDNQGNKRYVSLGEFDSYEVNPPSDVEMRLQQSAENAARKLEADLSRLRSVWESKSVDELLDDYQKLVEETAKGDPEKGETDALINRQSRNTLLLELEKVLEEKGFRITSDNKVLTSEGTEVERTEPATEEPTEQVQGKPGKLVVHDAGIETMTIDDLLKIRKMDTEGLDEEAVRRIARREAEAAAKYLNGEMSDIEYLREIGWQEKDLRKKSAKNLKKLADKMANDWREEYLVEEKPAEEAVAEPKKPTYSFTKGHWENYMTSKREQLEKEGQELEEKQPEPVQDEVKQEEVKKEPAPVKDSVEVSTPAETPTEESINKSLEEIKERAAKFSEETDEEFKAFEKSIGDMSDEVLLAYMKEDGNGDAEKAYHKSLYYEYEERHEKEYNEEYDQQMRKLLDGHVSQDEAMQMLENLKKKGYPPTKERVSILAQEAALKNFIRDVGVDRWIKENNWKEPEPKTEQKEGSPKPENKMQPAKVETEGKEETSQKGVVAKEEPVTVKPTEENIDKLLDAMKVKPEHRDVMKESFANDPEAFRKEWDKRFPAKQEVEQPKEQVGKQEEKQEEKKEEKTEEKSPAKSSMPMKDEDGDQVPDYDKATPTQIQKYLYSGEEYSKEEADEVVEHELDDAQKDVEAKKAALEKAQEEYEKVADLKPTTRHTTKTHKQYRAEQAEIAKKQEDAKAAVDKAMQELDDATKNRIKWEHVKEEREKATREPEPEPMPEPKKQKTRGGDKKGVDLDAIKKRVEKFADETPDESAEFNGLIPKMSDEELLAYMKEDGKDGYHNAHHPELWDEYDSRHTREYVEEYDKAMRSILDSGISREEAQKKLDSIKENDPRFTSNERTKFSAENEALDNYVNSPSSVEDWKKENNYESPEPKPKKEPATKTKAEETAEKFSLDGNGGAGVSTEEKGEPSKESNPTQRKGGFVDESEKRKWANRDKKMAEVMDEIAKKLGLNIRTFHSFSGERGRIVGDTIWVNASSSSPLGFIAGHEMLHDVQGVGGEMYEKYRTFAREMAKKRFKPSKRASTFEESMKNLSDMYWKHYKDYYVDKGYSEEEAAKLAEEHATIDKMWAEKEADESGYILQDAKAAVELLNRLDPSYKRTWKDIAVNIIDNILAKVSGKSKEYKQFKETKDALIEAFKASVKAREEKNKKLAESGDETITNMTDMAVQEEKLSLGTEPDVKAKLERWLFSDEAKKLGWTKEKADGVLTEIDNLIDTLDKALQGDKNYDEWRLRQPTVRVDWRDGESRPVVTWSRGNIEYKYDMSADLLCVNNEGMEEVLSAPAMVDILMNGLKETKIASKKRGTFSTHDYARLYETMKDLGFVVPCPGCFDYAARLKMLPSVAQSFAKEVNEYIDMRNKNPEAYDARLRKQAEVEGNALPNGLPATADTRARAIEVAIAGDNITEHINWHDLLTADGQTGMLAQYGGLFRAWQRTGAGRPKDKLLPEPWIGEMVESTSTIIAPYGEKTPSFREQEVNVGTGLRRNSHSEFRMTLIIDEIQMLREAFMKNLTVFKYMKELDDVRLFGKLGVKYNMSFFPGFDSKGVAAGLDAKGNYIAAEESVGAREFAYVGEDGKVHYDGMKGRDEAMKYCNENVSLSSIAFSVPHLIKLMTDVPTHKDKRGWVGSIIPFHSSGATAEQLLKQGLGMVRAASADGSSGTFEAEAMNDCHKGVTNFEQVQNDRFGEGWEIIEGKKKGTAVAKGHKMEFANGTHYYNQEKGIHLFKDGYVLDKELPNGGGKTAVSGKTKKDYLHPFVVDYNDKVREINSDYGYKDAADYYVKTLREIGMIPRFDFTVPEATFLKMCADANVDPHHPKLGWKGEGNDWNPVDSDAYYSMWCDYGMTDPTTGKWSPHRPVGFINENGGREFRLPDNAVEIAQEGMKRYTERRDKEASMQNDAIVEFAKRSVEAGRMDAKKAEEILKAHGIDPSGIGDIGAEIGKTRAEQLAEEAVAKGKKPITPKMPTQEELNKRVKFSLIGVEGARNMDEADGFEELEFDFDKFDPGKEDYSRDYWRRVAEHLEISGEDYSTIRMLTGWERGADGKWRYEIPDIVITDKKWYKKKETTLGKLVKAEDLFKAYPDLKGMKVTFKDLGDTIASYSPTTDEIEVNVKKNKDDIEEFRASLAHEIQHAIQHREGFASGGSDNINDRTSMSFKNASPEIKALILLNGDNSAELLKILTPKMLATAIDAGLGTRGNDKSVEGYFRTLSASLKSMDKADYETLIDEAERTRKIADAEAYQSYRKLAGEVEARNVQHRLNYDQDELWETPARDTEDVPRYQQRVKYSLVTDPKEIERLENEEVEYGYRNVSMKEDGTFRSPMANKLGKKGEKSRSTEPFKMNAWEKSDENPDLATDDGKINLIKPNGLGSVGAVDYNPYIHIRPTTLNKQFKNAWERNDLVYLKVAYPASELDKGYHAPKAKLSVGKHPWNGGELILSRWDKPIEIVPWEEVANEWVKEFKDRGVEFDIVPPKLLPILMERGVEILPPHKGMGKACNDAYREKVLGENPRFSLDPGEKAQGGTYFSGGGLIESGLEDVLDKRFGVEYNEKIAGVYRNNHGEHIVVADVRNVDPMEMAKKVDGPVQYFHASPVCKNASKLKKGAETELDKETATSTAQAIEKMRPRIVTIENVAGYKDFDSFKIITDKLDELGYTYDTNIVNAADYGAATNRERLILRAVADGYELPPLPKGDKTPTSWYSRVEDLIPSLKEATMPRWIDERLQNDGIDWRNVNEPLIVFGGSADYKKMQVAKRDEPAPTLAASGSSDDRIILPGGKVLEVTPRLLARVMGLPDSYELPKQKGLSHTVLGNGVPVELTKGVIEPLIREVADAADKVQFSLDPKIYEERAKMSVEEKEKLRDSEESRKLFDATKEKFGTTNDVREAGYILPDGTMLDFSGRHWMNEGDDTSHLAGNRAVDHRAIYEVGYDKEENETGFETEMPDFISRGAIRIHTGNGYARINLSMPPTPEQAKVLRSLVERNRAEIEVDFGNGYDSEHYADYNNVLPSRVLGDIDRFYNEGIKPQGTPQYSLDPEYMDAVQGGDMEKAQRMVDKSAEDAGYTIRGEHGTTHKFTIFNYDFANMENSFGKGHYFTNSKDDAKYNYASDEGADLTNRIELMAEQMEFWDGYENKSYEERKEEAKKQLNGGENRVISAALRMENPAVFGYDPEGKYKETFFDFEEPYDEEYDEYGEPSGLLVDFTKALQHELNEGDYFGADRVNVNDLYDGSDGYTADQLKKACDDMLAYVTDDEGAIASNEIFKNALKRMGFDGIIDNAPSHRFKNMGLGRSTKHFIVFDSNQIKQTDPVTYDDNGNVIPLSERFNLRNPDIRYSLGDLEGEDRNEYIRRLREIYSNGGDVDEAIRRLDEEFDQRNQQQPEPQVGDEPLPDTGFERPLTPMERAVEAQMKAINNVNTSDTVRRDAIKSVTKSIRQICNALKNMTFDKLEEETWQKLSDLDEAYEAGAFTKEEYERQKKELEALSKGDTNKSVRIATTDQRDYDRSTVEQIVNMARTLIESGLLDDLGRGKVKSILGKIKIANGKTKVGVKKEIDNLFNLMLDHQTKRTEDSILGLLDTPAAKINASGAKVVGTVDHKTKTVLDSMKMHLGKTEEDMNTVLSALLNKDTTRMSERELDEYNNEVEGALLANRYAQSVTSFRNNIAECDAELKRLKERYKHGEITMTEYRESKKAVEESIRNYKTEMVKGLWETEASLRERINSGKSGVKTFYQKTIDRANEVRHWAYSDLKDAGVSTQRDRTKKEKRRNKPLHQILVSSLYTFNTMLRELGSRAQFGQGYLYDGMGRTWLDNQSNLWKDTKADMDELDAKAHELFGNLHMFGKGPSVPGLKVKWHNLIDILHRLPTITVEYRDGSKEKSPHVLEQSKAAYIYAANKQADGAVKLRAMGISEADVERIKNELDPRVVELMDWLQKDFLPSRYKGYSEVHERLFGVPMTMNENYFPLEIDKMSIPTEEDEKGRIKAVNASTVTGSIKERTFNINPLDIWNTNVISLVSKHLENMNHWKNFAEWNRDLNTLLNDSRFKRKLHNVQSTFGSGKTFWTHFRDTALIASGDYMPAGGDSRVDKAILNWAKLVSAAKVSARFFTSMKQALSFATFVGRSRPEIFLKNLALNFADPFSENGTIRWCFANLPLFEKRWVSRRAGDPRLSDTDLDWDYTKKKMVRWLAKWGLTPNAMVDLWACSVGARSVYDTNKARYLKEGYSEEESHKRAIQDAQVAFNESQQSSESMFLSPIQVDRTIDAVGLSTFRSASFGFTRLAYRATKDLENATNLKRAFDIASFMYKKARRDNLTTTQARNIAKGVFRHQAWRGICELFMYAFGAQFMWNVGGKSPFLLASDDDDKRKTILKEEAIHAGVAGWLEGLPFGNLASDQISTLINIMMESNNVKEGWDAWKKQAKNFDPDLLPIASDISKGVQELFGKKYLEGMNDFLNLAVQANIGVNPETFTDAVVAILDRCNGDPKLASEALLMWYRIANAPQSQIDDLMLEEIGATGMSGEKAKKLTVDDVVSRYVNYKNDKGTLYTWRLFNDDERKELVESYENKFYEKIYASADNPAAYRKLIDLSVYRRDKFIKKYVESLEEFGPVFLYDALREEKAEDVKAALTKAYFKAIKPEEAKDAETQETLDAYKKDKEDDSDKELKAAAKYLGTDDLISYRSLTTNTRGFYATNDTLMAKVKSIDGNFGVNYNKVSKGDTTWLDIDQVSFKIPSKDKVKRKKVLDVLENNRDHFARILRAYWRNHEIKRLIKEADKNPEKKADNVAKIRVILKAEDADNENYKKVLEEKKQQKQNKK